MDKMYEDRGEGLRKKEKETIDKKSDKGNLGRDKKGKDGGAGADEKDDEDEDDQQQGQGD